LTVFDIMHHQLFAFCGNLQALFLTIATKISYSGNNTLHTIIKETQAYLDNWCISTVDWDGFNQHLLYSVGHCLEVWHCLVVHSWNMRRQNKD